MSALYFATQQRESTSCVATSYSIPSARDDPSGSNSKLQEMISTVPGSEVEESFSFSFAFSTEFDSDCQYSEIVQGPSISPTRMSPADELFQNGKIRPLQVSPQTNSVSFYEEIPETARVEVHEAYGYQFRRSASFEILNSKVIASTSATDCWEDAEIVDYRLSCGGEGIKETEKGDGHKTNWDSRPPTSILNHCAAPEPKTRNHVIHRRCHTLTPLSSLFHIDERKEFITGDSSESGTKAIRGRRSSNAEDHDQQQAWTLKTSKGPGRTLRLKELLWNKDSSKDQQQKVDEFEGLNSKECCMRQLMTESNTNYSSKNFKLQDSSTNLSNNLSTNLSGTAMVKEMKNSSSARVDALQCRYNKGICKN